MKKEVLTGTIIGNERGYGFFMPDDGEGDFFVSHSDLRGAYHKDTVLCECVTTPTKTHARVLKIIKRGTTELCGTYTQRRNGGLVIPDDSKFFDNVFIPQGVGKRAKSGDKVVVKITSYPKRLSPEGVVKEVLGKQFSKSAEVRSIMWTYKVQESFPDKVNGYAKAISEKITDDDISGLSESQINPIKREDFRDKTVFTIDGDTAKDFDDAVSIERSGENYILGVHIADVSHYVIANDVIDKEAYQRATSVYFPESVSPMLPETLCNGVCSLKEGVDRLTLSCVMTIDKRGKVVEYRVVPSVINSKARLTYSKVQKIIDGDKNLRDKYSLLVDDILLMNDLKNILVEKRDKAGNIDLDIKESAITVDGDKIEISPRDRGDSERLIEEFMILANCTVASFISYTETPFVYRIHEKPTEEKVKTLYEILDGIGVKYKRKKGELYSKDFQTILKSAEGMPAFNLVNSVMLRSMQKAKYSPYNVGHFGLSEDCYCHFTSPIRRYPDLIVHRIIKDVLRGERDLELKYSNYVEESSKHCSLMERNSIEAERQMDNYYKMLYIQNYIGFEFDAVVSGVMGFGIFCELQNGVEGLVRVERLKGKNINYEERKFSLSDGINTYKLGQEVKIRVDGVDMVSKRAEFSFIY